MHGNFTYNSSCTFSCEEGFVRMGAELLRCEATGNWSRDAPVCAGTSGPPAPPALQSFQLSSKHILNVVEGDLQGLQSPASFLMCDSGALFQRMLPS